MTDITELTKRMREAAEKCIEQEPLKLVEYHGKLYLRNKSGIVFTVSCDASNPDFTAENENYARLAESVSANNAIALLDALSQRDAQIAELREQIAELREQEIKPAGMQFITEAIGAHGYIVGCMRQNRPDLALEESLKWVKVFGQAAELMEGK
ncbi:hypothetical protein [Mixta intestinalis]|uniref:Ead/Ea22-like family protein n=1 Tax=Mixta intestinalis TaxID=1615494 RepID=A0A6P1PZ80_9GAMM|nr:hypothetical protein [Mixta intestinalis]QHM71324.1 hypothetical protein C7M51_01610 [Mixta intestinalis]